MTPRPLAHRCQELADGGPVERVIQLVRVAGINGPRREVLDLLAMFGEFDPVLLQQGGEIANTVRVLDFDLIEGEDSLDALLDRLLDVLCREHRQARRGHRAALRGSPRRRQPFARGATPTRACQDSAMM
jgi:hypothetical protein